MQGDVKRAQILYIRCKYIVSGCTIYTGRSSVTRKNCTTCNRIVNNIYLQCATYEMR